MSNVWHVIIMTALNLSPFDSLTGHQCMQSADNDNGMTYCFSITDHPSCLFDIDFALSKRPWNFLHQYFLIASTTKCHYALISPSKLANYGYLLDGHYIVLTTSQHMLMETALELISLQIDRLSGEMLLFLWERKSMMRIHLSTKILRANLLMSSMLIQKWSFKFIII